MMSKDNRDFITLSITGEDADKYKTKQSIWRVWNRLSRLQKNVLSVFLVVVLVTVAVIILHTDRGSLDIREKDISDDDRYVQLHRRNKVEAINDFVNERKKQQESLNMEHKDSVLEKPPEKSHADSLIQESVAVEKVVQHPEPPIGSNGDNGVNGVQGNVADVNNEGPGKNNNHISAVRPKDIEDILHHDDGIPMEFMGAQNERQKAVTAAFQHAWTAYKKYAWGYDQLKPVTRSHHEWFGLGLTIIDALDTMYIMDLKEEFKEGRDWVEQKLNLSQNKDVNLFEVTIRVLGGLLSTYHLSQDRMFLDRAKELGDKLMPAFTSESGVPFSDVNLYYRQGKPPKWGPDSTVSEVATIQLEFRDLSRATGDPKYEEAAWAVSQKLHNTPKFLGLVPMFINAQTGQFRSATTLTLGARADSYYEYLLKQWLQTGRKIDWLKDDFMEAVEGIKKHMWKKSASNNLSFIGELLRGTSFSPKMDHLVCYFAGALGLGWQYGLGIDDELLDMAQELMHTCYQMYAQMPTFLSPEIAHFNMLPGSKDDIFVKTADAHNLLRPETIESLYILYQLTGARKYQDMGWRIFTAFEKHARLDGQGYTSLSNVKNADQPGWRDSMESFFLGETLKYFYLLFDDNPRLVDLRTWVFNTEAHPLPLVGS
ncbi:PREDICTED: endoplasmic reticulum mannosyl-oligosaccharide 1,2-alpha-mannosidase-like [Priapulus caudatus]|uniref:alpha-1,2-Mannosidase n=1 Tax=Priapulus caudatus TaxID=37621 RepID=A0ABM1EH62_PRICU|nr:PREDICTED: endoplasmic reticulum mannosyl-oligosaccharide 1,2-alpha-mannosidase-like [Priapulus caudatus]